MMYDPAFTEPMRQELLRLGVVDLRTPADVDAFLAEKSGTALVIVNSVCGCAAGMARPGAAKALAEGPRPDRVGTVFAGVDTDATKRARDYFGQLAPSSPSFCLFKDGKVAFFLPRYKIEGRDAESVAADLKAAFAAAAAVPATA